MNPKATRLLLALTTPYAPHICSPSLISNDFQSPSLLFTPIIPSDSPLESKNSTHITHDILRSGPEKSRYRICLIYDFGTCKVLERGQNVPKIGDFLPSIKFSLRLKSPSPARKSKDFKTDCAFMPVNSSFLGKSKYSSPLAALKDYLPIMGNFLNIVLSLSPLFLGTLKLIC